MDYNSENSRLELSEQNKQLIQQVFELELDGHKDARDLYKEEIAGFLVKTEDGSYTLVSDRRMDKTETLHSTYGARTEAFEKFAIPSKLLEKSESNSVLRILDLCSGIGYNTSAILDYLKGSDVEIEIDMVDSCIETLATSLFIPSIGESYEYIKKTIESYLIEQGYLQYNKVLSTIPNNITINIHVCDAREYIKNCDEKEYDAVFLDPFSPSRSPELYTVDFFSHLKQFLTPTALILTYTAACAVRSAFIEAGLYIGEGPEFHRSGGTIASRSPNLIDTPLSFSDEKVIALSDVGVPFIDPNLNDDYETIVNRRQSMREKIRGVSVFPSSNKLPRFLGINPVEITDLALRNKLTAYVMNMGFNSLDDPQIMEILKIDPHLNSRDQILQLKENLRVVLNNQK